MARKISKATLLFMAIAAVIVLYVFRKNSDGFQTDASGNTTTFVMPTWGWVLIGIVVVGLFVLSVWEKIVQIKAIGSVATGVGSGIANAGKGVLKWGESLGSNKK